MFTSMNWQSIKLPGRRQAIRCLAFWLVLLLGGAALPFQILEAQPAIAPEYSIKAGLLTAFTSYTEWPSNAFAGKDDPIIIGVLGENPFGEVLAKTAAQQVGARTIQVRHLASAEAADGCHLVFISAAEKSREENWLAVLKDKPIVTVGESGHTLERGGILELKTVAGRVRFDVSLPATQQAGVKFTPQMLALANKVIMPQTEAR